MSGIAVFSKKEVLELKETYHNTLARLALYHARQLETFEPEYAKSGDERDGISAAVAQHLEALDRINRLLGSTRIQEAWDNYGWGE